jgi:photosystem II stability/assembly factor-like uncharacterized protein
MTTHGHQTYVYVGLAGEGESIGDGGLYRCIDGDWEWQSITKGLPPQPQVRTLVMHPQNPAVLYAGTQAGPYRSDDRGAHWEALATPASGKDNWSLAFHPHNPDIMYAGYEPCAIYRSEDAGAHWRQMDTSKVVFPHVTTYMPPLGKRVFQITVDPLQPQYMYAAIEVGGLLASEDGGATWECITDGLYVRNNTVDLHGVQMSTAAPDSLFIITQIAMFRSRDRGRHWQHIRIEEMFPGGSYCRHLLVAPNDPRTMYLAASAGGGGAPAGTREAGALFRSRDLGETWDRLDLGETPGSRTGHIAIDQNMPSRLYCCTQMGTVYSSHDSGATWSKHQLDAEFSRSRRIYPMVCG